MSFHLGINEADKLALYLIAKGLLPEGASITKLEKAGEGNMNLTLRAHYSTGTLIVKQANPFVQKYPSIPAPVERAEMEFDFFRKAGKIEALRPFLPKPIYNDPVNHLQVIEDLGAAGDFTRYYALDQIPNKKDVETLIGFLKDLHHSTCDSEPVLNLSMRVLNHDHIFLLPFDPENGFDLDAVHEGLKELADSYIFQNEKLRMLAKKLGEAYLSARGPSLLHGDFFPGSWLETRNGIKIIDPEFSFSGPVEFDIGVFKAHLLFCGVDAPSIDKYLQKYGAYDFGLVDQFAGVEILRRLFGVAQLPIPHNIEEKETLTKQALALLKL